MCSIIATNIIGSAALNANKYTKNRGPDHLSYCRGKGIQFVHNLLSITGKFTPQPFVDKENEILCLFNGEIYNAFDLGYYKTDGECLIPLYKEYGDDIAKHLDGEYAILIVDYRKKEILLISDAFLTKPLWFFKNNKEEWGIGTYKSCINLLGLTSDPNEPIRMPPNKTLIFDLDLNFKRETSNIEWCLNQYKSNYDDWVNAFQQSMYKRAVSQVREKIFIGMSSGYDSGAIACELNEQEAPFHIYSVVSNENKEILKKRFSMVNRRASISYLGHDDIINSPDWQDDYNVVNSQFLDCRGYYKSAQQYIRDMVEPYTYEIYSDRSNYTEHVQLHSDGGACAFALICHLAKRDEKKIYISGSGADEIYSDYGWNGVGKTKHSNFGGMYPDDLSSIFPWPSFYGSSQISYLTKEEMVGGSYGIECRYPFLDPKCVQEFLWLKPKLKNKYYKSVIHYYLKEHDFPFCENQKIGFWF